MKYNINKNIVKIYKIAFGKYKMKSESYATNVFDRIYTGTHIFYKRPIRTSCFRGLFEKNDVNWKRLATLLDRDTNK